MNVDLSGLKLKEAVRRLESRGLMKVGDSLSQRLAGTGQIAFAIAGNDHVQLLRLISVVGEVQSDQHLRQHVTIFQSRPDVGAVLINRQPWAFALAEMAESMPGIFDEQIRHLGTSVTLLPHQLLTPEHGRLLGNGENAFVLPQQVLCLGMTLDRAVFNAELLEKCAKAFVLATSTGRPVGKIPWLVRWIANGRLLKDERYAAQQYALGLTPVFKSAY